MKTRGFTFVELLVAMVLMGIVSTSIYKLLSTNQRVYREQGVKVDLNQNVRAAASILPSELRELDASDGDIVAMTSSALTYNSMRNIYFVCQTPNTATMTITLGATPWFGSQALDVGEQLFVAFAENDPSKRSDDAWLKFNSTVRVNGVACPGAAASITLTVTGITAAQLSGIATGAPLRGYKVVQVLRYQDANGAYWIGSLSQNKTSLGWSTIEPIVGPITSTGLVFTYYDIAGAVTAVTTNVARIAISVTGQSAEPVRGNTSTMRYPTSNVVSQVALRNNKRY